MQFDLFSGLETEAVSMREAAPPVLTGDGKWRRPETVVFEKALKARDLGSALRVVEKFKLQDLQEVLLQAGFVLQFATTSRELLATVQGDILRASSWGMTGWELQQHKDFLQRQEKEEINRLHESAGGSIFLSDINKSEKDHGNARIDEARTVRRGDGFEHRAPWLDSSDGSQSLGAGLAGTSGSVGGERLVPEGAVQASRDREGHLVGGDGVSAPGGARDSGVARNSDGAADPDRIDVTSGEGQKSGLLSLESEPGVRTALVPDSPPPNKLELPNTASSSSAPVDYVLTEDDRIGLGGLAEKFADNLAAIQLVKRLQAEGRHALPEEQRVLARYVGWGGLKGVFDPDNKQWGRQHQALKSLLTEKEWGAASRSVLDAFYTSPEVVNAIYAGLGRLGFSGGVTLDPSVGVGNFFGFMPASMRENSTLHGVELDVLTSQIVSAIYPTAQIASATGFENYQVPAGYFDLVVGNPPFGSQPIVDETGAAYSGWSIHNYFFAKSIQKLRPGGLMAMVVSHNFLDKLDPHVRQWIARRADLVSGVRLPYTAFLKNANTEVVTDVLIFQRRDDLSLGAHEAPVWLDTTDVDLINPKTGESHVAAVNNYFLANPRNVLGVPSAAGTMYSAGEYTVEPFPDSEGSLGERLSAWVESLPQGLYQPMERSTSIEDGPSILVPVPEGGKEGSFFRMENGHVGMRLPDLLGKTRGVQWEPPNAKALDRMLGMIHIRTILREQMSLERSANSTDEAIAGGRAALNRVYDNFYKKYGYLNDPVNRRLFMDDTESALVQALEFDYEKAITPAKAEEYGIDVRPSSARKADIFRQRVLFPPMDISHVETAKDALLHSLNHYGQVNMDYMTEAYGKGEEEILLELDGVVYRDPKKGLVTADEYLSGDVKTRLAEAKKAADSNPLYSKNIAALEAVIPADKLPSEIFASIGAIWIPPEVYSQFAKEISGASVTYTHLRSAGQWLSGTRNGVNYVQNNSEYGTAKMGALDILNNMMNGRGVEVKMKVMTDGKERYVTDETETEAARQKADKIRSLWDSWVWRDNERTDRLSTIYNDGYNRTVERRYDGSHLTFPGMSPAITLLGHQKNGVWRGIQDRSVLLDHVVGAGKTFQIVTIFMEMRRLGIARKPILAVPNHLTLQWRDEFYRLYPGANVLAATPQDFDKEHREKMFSKIVTGNWDAVIIGHSSLKKIGLPLEAEKKIFQEQLDEITEAIESMKRERGDKHLIRDMERIKVGVEAKLKTLKEKGGKKDNVVDFADLGVDAMAVDELHEFKNLFFYTQMQRVSGLGNPAGSGKAMDLFIKTRWLKDTYGANAPFIGATGTPVSNSLAEMFTVQRYMQYDHLRNYGLHNFDSWAKQYGDVQTVYEVAPSGSGYRLSQRFSKFKNLPSLMGSYRSFADVVTLDDLKRQEAALGRTFPVPQIVSGRPINVVAPRSELQEKFFGVPEIQIDEAGNVVFELDLERPFSIEENDGKWRLKTDQGFDSYGTREEAEMAVAIKATTPRVQIDPQSIVGQFENLRELTRRTNGKINALSLTGLANKAGLDFRLIDPNAPDFEGSKINLSVGNMMEMYHKWHADKGTQLVFCDLSVPLSAKKKMATTEKRIYVRAETGRVTHKRGTLHVVQDYEGLPYYLVAEGRGKDRSFAMHDPMTGHILRNGFDTKADAHDWAKRFLSQENGQEQWLDLRDSAPLIAQEEIDEYKNEHGLADDIEAADTEISREDIDGASGASGFSVYDDIKAKLIARGVPAHEIEFIHDHDTPQAKDALFKRMRTGQVRFLFGSTPKMGAGTNVQDLLVAKHDIDAPWRPSDLEQRDGRIIRRGNRLYERDPAGFEVALFRYATSQTYDTRRWQLLEHKAAGVEQLRNYKGESEIDDVAAEAANAADMKAAASGNPLILKETQLAAEVKKLRVLAAAHLDSQFVLRNRLRVKQNWASVHGPQFLEDFNALVAARDRTTSKGELLRYQERLFDDKEAATQALAEMGKYLLTMGARRTVTYKGMVFIFKRESADGPTMTYPTGEEAVLKPFSPSGVLTRMENCAQGLENRIEHTKTTIRAEQLEADALKAKVDAPFDKEDDLNHAIAEHAKVQRALMKATSLDAVKPEDRSLFDRAVMRQKELLMKMGYRQALKEMQVEEGDELGASTTPEIEALPAAMSTAANTPIAESPDERRARLLSEPIIRPDGIEVATTGEHWGKVEAVRDGYVFLNVGRGVVKAHAVADMDWIPLPQSYVGFHYGTGAVRVSDFCKYGQVER